MVRFCNVNAEWFEWAPFHNRNLEVYDFNRLLQPFSRSSFNELVKRERERDFKMMDLNERTNLTPLDRLTIVMGCVKRVIFLETEITAYDNRSSKIMCFSSLTPNEQDCKASKLLDY